MLRSCVKQGLCLVLFLYLIGFNASLRGWANQRILTWVFRTNHFLHCHLTIKGGSFWGKTRKQSIVTVFSGFGDTLFTKKRQYLWRFPHPHPKDKPSGMFCTEIRPEFLSEFVVCQKLAPKTLAMFIYWSRLKPQVSDSLFVAESAFVGFDIAPGVTAESALLNWILAHNHFPPLHRTWEANRCREDRCALMVISIYISTKRSSD